MIHHLLINQTLFTFSQPLSISHRSINMGCGGSKEYVPTSTAIVPARRRLLCPKSDPQKPLEASGKPAVPLSNEESFEDADERKLIARGSSEEYFSTRKDDDSMPVAAAAVGEGVVEYYSPPHELQYGIMLDANGDAKALDVEEDNVPDLAPKYDDYEQLNSHDSAELKETILVEKLKAELFDLEMKNSRDQESSKIQLQAH